MRQKKVKSDSKKLLKKEELPLERKNAKEIFLGIDLSYEQRAQNTAYLINNEERRFHS